MADWSRRKILIGAGSAACVAGLPLTASAGETVVIGGMAFGTYWRITLSRRDDARVARRTVEAVVALVDSRMSPFRPDSEISRFNALPTTGWVEISPGTHAVIEEGCRIARLTDGAFDPTVGPIVGRFGFGPITGARTGTYRDILTDEARAQKRHPGLTFDPCGIAKGHALDRIIANLDGLGLRRYLIDLGGEVYARGHHPDGRPWQVGIERPGRSDFGIQRIVRLAGEALATSGDSVNAYAVAGRRYSHIIDPHTGEPVTNEVRAVSVIAPRAMTADALATALMVMGPQQGMALAHSEDLAALFILNDGGRLKELATERFNAYIVA